VRQAREFIAARPAELAGFLAVGTPQPPAARACPPLTRRQEPKVEPAPVPPPSGGAEHVAAGIGALTLGRIDSRRNGVAVEAIAPATGALMLRGTIRTRDGNLSACPSTSADASAAGPAQLRCSFSHSLRDRLAKRWLRLRLTVSFVPPGGAPQRLERTVVLPRT
jgi:hypothetical protein